MSIRLSDLWNWRGTIDRGPYLFWGLLLGIVKYNLDRMLIWHWSGQRWSLLDYTRFGEYLWPQARSFERFGGFAVMLALSLPFMTIGVMLTLRRLRSAKLSPWMVLLFFMPVIKLIFFAALAVIPPAEERAARRQRDAKAMLGILIPQGAKGAALAGIAVAIANAVICIWLGVTVLRQYGWSLFIGVPFALGFLSVLVFGYHQRRTLRQCLGVATLSTVASGLCVLAISIEGFVCLIMAFPLALPMALLGGFVAHGIQASSWWQGENSGTLCIALLPLLLMLIEHAQPPPVPQFSVTTSAHVAAPPARVWKKVVSFPDLPPARELIFRAGIAYPIRARIQGAGPGAIRYCEFSTGSFVEPITVWNEPSLLRFSVTENPAPMQEWTPYTDLHPAHLDGFMVSKAGQFELKPMPDGSTQLEGTTWYSHHLWPATYWRWWSDYIIHTIHRRVLLHVKVLAEKDLERGSAN